MSIKRRVMPYSQKYFSDIETTMAPETTMIPTTFTTTSTTTTSEPSPSKYTARFLFLFDYFS